MSELEHSTVDILALHDRARARDYSTRVGSAAVGLLLTGVAAFSDKRHAFTRALLTGAGGLLIARAVSGKSVRQLAGSVRDLFSYRSDLEKRFHDGEHDIVDAASFDSFPASDPPSYSPGAS